MESADVTGAPVQVATAEVGLTRTMHGFGALLITLSCLSPSIGVFIVGSDVMKTAGTAVFACFCGAVVLGVAMACVYAEAASAFPSTGGEYTILGRALGPVWGFTVLGLNLVGFAVAQSLSGLGCAEYLAVVFPGLPAAPTAAALVGVVTLTGVLNIRVNAAITGAFLAVEIGALLLLAWLGLAHPHRSLAAAVLHPVTISAAGALVPVALATAGAAAAGAIYAFNGYGAVVFLGEELHEASRAVVQVVFLSLAVAAVTELLPLLAVLVGAPDLRALFAAERPIPAYLAAAGGPALSRAMSLGVALAIFNAMIAVALMGGRILFATGRDRVWPSAINRALTRIHTRFHSPWVGTLVLGVAGTAGCFLDQKLLVLFLGNGNVAIYAGLCLAVIVGRRSGATGHAGWRMPLFPLAPALALVALAAIVISDLQDVAGLRGLLSTLAIMTAAALYYLFVLRPRGVWRFTAPADA